MVNQIKYAWYFILSGEQPMKFGLFKGFDPKIARNYFGVRFVDDTLSR